MLFSLGLKDLSFLFDTKVRLIMNGKNFTFLDAESACIL
jgi:hypothetical protein